MTSNDDVLLPDAHEAQCQQWRDAHRHRLPALSSRFRSIASFLPSRSHLGDATSNARMNSTLSRAALQIVPGVKRIVAGARPGRGKPCASVVACRVDRCGLDCFRWNGDHHDAAAG
jgi:hypothetical protein